MSGERLPAELRPLLPYPLARNRQVLLCQQPDGRCWLITAGNLPARLLAEARRIARAPVQVRRVPAEEFVHLLDQAYARREGEAAQVMDDLEAGIDLSELAQELPKINDLLEADDDAPIIRLLNALLTEALRAGASDIHIEPFEERSVVRFRVDGLLRDVLEPQRALHAAIVSRIKIMANLDIAEKRLPQDGRISLRLAGRAIDVRVSTLPVGHGERVVLRLLDKQGAQLDLARLGMSASTHGDLVRIVREPHGIVLVTGPTGSGKTTTLYAALGGLDGLNLNRMTVEDPIEYDLDGINQTQVNARIDMTFARALRAILRQDPDVVMIGEIRDLETAQIAVQASLTGHLVLATLHTNDAPGAIIRLADMGVEPFLLASSLLGVLAQRLVRRLCPACRQAVTPDASERRRLGLLSDGPIHAARGCAACNQTGYRGRIGIYQLLLVDDALRHLIHDGETETALRNQAIRAGMLTLREDGMRHVMQGTTSVEEVLRVTQEN